MYLLGIRSSEEQLKGGPHRLALTRNQSLDRLQSRQHQRTHTCLTFTGQENGHDALVRGRFSWRKTAVRQCCRVSLSLNERSQVSVVTLLVDEPLSDCHHLVSQTTHVASVPIDRDERARVVCACRELNPGHYPDLPGPCRTDS